MIASSATAISWLTVSDAERLMLACHADTPHCRRVAAHARSLFHWLQDEFTVSDPIAKDALLERLWLAGLLHDIGHVIADQGHHRHSHYLIRNAHCLRMWDNGLRKDVAALSYCHRKVASKAWLKTHLGGNRDLWKAAAILRVADGLDRSHHGEVEVVSGERTAAAFTLHVRGLSSEYANRLATHKADAWYAAFRHSFVLKT